MEELKENPYRIYRLGCGEMGWTPLPENEFRYLYRLYRECRYPLFGPASGLVSRMLHLLTIPFRLHHIRRNRRLKKQLGFLATAMDLGHRFIDPGDDGMDSRGIPVAPIPAPPVRTGSAAKEIERLRTVTVLHGAAR